jgi:CRISPR-associated protein Cas5d
MEVAGPLAIFARPDTGGTPTSYPAPTWSAVKGMFESIAFFADGAAWICPTRVEVCRAKRGAREEPASQGRGGRVRWQRYTTNYGGPLRKSDLLRKGLSSGGSSMQLFATVLSGVCYRLHGEVVGPRGDGRRNPRHHLRDLFARRLRQGQCHRTPCLGWSEFTCTYWGPFRANLTEVDTALSIEIPSMLVAVWDGPVGRIDSGATYSPRYSQGHRDRDGRLTRPLKIEGGVLEYPVPDEWLRQGGADAQ